jgi:hypothetical protein
VNFNAFFWNSAPLCYEGPRLKIEEDNFSLFETQVFTPFVRVISENEFVNLKSKVKKVLDQLNPPGKKWNTKKASSDGDKGKVDIVNLDDDDDDFVTELARKLTDKRSSKAKKTRSLSSSDDFVTPAARAPEASPQTGLVVSNKRPPKVAVKLRRDIPTFIPYTFPHISKAKHMMELILEKDFIKQHGK